MRGARLFWPLLLILVGVVALLVNVGTLPAAALWRLANLWPLILVLIGAEIIVTRLLPPRPAAAVSAVLLLIFAAGALAYAALAPGVSGTAGTVVSSAPAGALTSARLELDVVAAQVEITTATGPNLYQVRIDYPAGAVRPLVSFDQQTGTVRIRPGSSGALDFLRFAPGKQTVELTLSRSVTWSLSLQGAAVDGRADVGAGRLSAVTLDSAAGHLDLVLPRPQGTVPSDISAAAFQGALHLPAGVPARIQASGAAARVNAFGQQLSGFGDRTWTSPGYATAAPRYDVRVSGAASEITID